MDTQPITPNPQAPVMAAALPPVPMTWPGAFGLFKYSREAVRVNLVPLIMLALISIVLSAVTEALGDLGSIISIPLNVIIGITGSLLIIAGIHRQKLSISDAFSQGMPFVLKYLGLVILLVAALTGSLLLFIIPFFFVFPRVALSFYYLIDQKMGIRESIQASWDQTKGHVGKFWGVVLATIVMFLPVITIIGIPVAIYLLFMYQAATVVLYFFIKAQQTTTPTAAGSPLGAAPSASVGAPAPQSPTPPVSTL